jgi:hypothetical protein
MLDLEASLSAACSNYQMQYFQWEQNDRDELHYTNMLNAAEHLYDELMRFVAQHGMHSFGMGK